MLRSREFQTRRSNVLQSAAKVEVEENRDRGEVVTGAGFKKFQVGTVVALSLCIEYPQEYLEYLAKHACHFTIAGDRGHFHPGPSEIHLSQ